MKRNLQILTVFGTFALSLSACDMKKQLTEMHDSTARLEDNTKKMGDTTTGMSETTLSMSETTKNVSKTTDSLNEKTQSLYILTSELFDMARMNDSSMQRRAAFQEIRSAKSLGMKISEAAKYFASFEYQLFNGLAQDLPKEKREDLQTQATAEFFRSIKEFDTVNANSKALAQAEGSAEENKDASFNAVAAALHIMNRKQKEYLINNKLKETEKVSMLSMIINSLEKKDAINKGEIRPEEISEYAKEVLANEPVAVKLLQARVNVFSTILMVEVSHIKSWPLVKQAAAAKLATEKSVVKKIGEAMAEVVDATDPHWTLNVEEFNLIQLQKFQQLMKEVIDGQKLLVSLGVTPHVDENLKSVYSYGKLGEIKNQTAGALKDNQQSFKELFTQFLATQK